MRLNPRVLTIAISSVVGLGAAVGALVGAAADSFVLGLATLTAGAVLVYILGQTCRPAATILWAAFATRTALALVQAYVAPLPDSQADAFWFEQIGWEWAQQGLTGVVGNFGTGGRLYTWLISFLYALTGRSPLMIQGLNVTLGTLVVFNAFRLGEELWGTKRGRHVGWAAALFPTLNLYSALIMRETVVTFALTQGMVHVIRWRGTHRVGPFALSLAWFVIATGFHTGMAITLVALAMLAANDWTRAFLKGWGRTWVRVTFAGILLVMVTVAVVRSGWGLGKLGALKNLSVQVVASSQESAARGRASYLEGVSVRTPLDLLRHIPTRVAHFLFLPFPWMVVTPLDMAGLFDATLYMVLMAMLLSRSRVVWGNRQWSALVTVSGLVLITFALATSNYGTAVRHRAKLVPLLIVAVPPRRTGSLRRRQQPSGEPQALVPQESHIHDGR